MSFFSFWQSSDTVIGEFSYSLDPEMMSFLPLAIMKDFFTLDYLGQALTKQHSNLLIALYEIIGCLPIHSYKIIH